MNEKLPVGPDTLCDRCRNAREGVVELDQLLRRAAALLGDLLEDLDDASLRSLSPEKATKLLAGLPAAEVPPGLLAGIEWDHHHVLGVPDAASRCRDLLVLARQRLDGLESQRLKEAAKALLTSIGAAVDTGRPGLPGAPWNPEVAGSTWAELKAWRAELERVLAVGCDHVSSIPPERGPTLEGILAEPGHRVHVGLEDLSVVLDLSPRRVRDLRKEPGFPGHVASNPKRWDLGEVAEWARANGREIAEEEEFLAGLRKQLDVIRERIEERSRSASNSLDGESRHKG